MHYPDIYIPSTLNQIKDVRLPTPQAPTAPEHPQKPSWLNSIMVGFVWLFFAAILLNIIPSLILLLPLGVTFLHRFIARQSYETQVLQFQKDKQNYSNLLREYETRKPESNETYRDRLLKGFAQRIYKPDGYDGKATVGANESKLVQAMARYFDGQIIQGTFLNHPDHDYPYFPDICYIHKGIYFDIEVDEPYGYLNKKPIHGHDEWKDSKRNQFFVGRCWVVIRLAEEQVVRYPDGCCKAIAKIINQTIGTPIPQSLLMMPDVPIIERWTLNEAESMAYRNYRDTYL